MKHKDPYVEEINRKLDNKIKLRKGRWYKIYANILGTTHRTRVRGKLIEKHDRFLLFRTEAGYKTSVLKIDLIIGDVKLEEDR